MTDKPEESCFLPVEVFQFEIEQSDEPLISRSGLVLPHQMAGQVFWESRRARLELDSMIEKVDMFLQASRKNASTSDQLTATTRQKETTTLQPSKTLLGFRPKSILAS